MRTLVSVMVPAFRAEATLARALASLLAQSWTDWEAVVVSDDLTDYAPLLRAAGLDDPRIRFASTGAVGAGPSVARNAGLALARGGLIAALDADDLFEPDRLAVLAPLAEREGAAVDNVRVVRERDGQALSTLFPSGPGRLDLDDLAFLATSVPMFAVARREIEPGWEPDIFFAEDVVRNLQIIDRLGRLPVTLRPLYEYRQRDGSITASASSGEQAEAGYRHVLERLAADGLRIADPERQRLFAEAVAAKRARNAAFMEARAAGHCETFQEFLALQEA